MSAIQLYTNLSGWKRNGWQCCDEPKTDLWGRIKHVPIAKNITSFCQVRDYEGGKIVGDMHLRMDELGTQYQAIGGILYGPERGFKATYWHKGLPYWIRRDHGLVRASSLHFQGSSKKVASRWLSSGFEADPEKYCFCPSLECEHMVCLNHVNPNPQL